MKTSSPILLSVVIVNWNVRDLLGVCLQTLEVVRDALAFEVIVVDGDSVDGSQEMVKREFPWVNLIECQENVGFPRGNNLGISRASGDYILFLNPDTEIQKNALPLMVEYLLANPDVGIVGPQLNNPDGSIQSSRRRFPSLAIGFLESTWLEGFAPARTLQRYYAQDMPDDVTADVDWMVGACLMVRREVIEQVGGMDEAFFMYSEELDWCRRVVDSGWRVVYYPEAKVVHHVGKSSGQAVTSRHINFQRAKLRYFRKYHGPFVTTLLRLFLLSNYLWQMGLEGFKGMLGHRRSLRWQRVKSYWQVLRSGLRPAGY